MDKMKFKKIGNIVLNVLMYIFLAFCIFTVIVTLLSKRDSDGAAEIFGYQMRIVTSDSMAKSEYTDVSDYKIKDIPVRSMVFVKVMPSDPEKADEWYRSLKVGDVLTFRYVYATQVTITHRITSIVEKETGGFIIELAGDNKDSDDGQLHQVIDTSVPNNTNYVIGKVTAKAYLLGAIMSFLMTPLGIVLAIIVPCLAIILLEILNIAKAVTEDRRKKDREEDEKKDEELKELRRRIAELEKEKSEQDTANEPSDADNADESSEGEETAEPEADEHEETAEAKDTAEEAADNNETGEKGIGHHGSLSDRTLRGLHRHLRAILPRCRLPSHAGHVPHAPGRCPASCPDRLLHPPAPRCGADSLQSLEFRHGNLGCGLPLPRHRQHFGPSHLPGSSLPDRGLGVHWVGHHHRDRLRHQTEKQPLSVPRATVTAKEYSWIQRI